MRFRKSYLCIIVTLLLSTFGYAAEDFTFWYGDYIKDLTKFDTEPKLDDYYLCMGEKRTAAFFVKNLEDKDKTLFFEVDGPKFMQLSQYSAYIKPDQLVGVYVVFDPEDTDLGNYTMNLDVFDSKTKIRKRLTRSIIVEDCYGLDIEIDGAESFCACVDDLDFSVSVKNSGKFLEIVSLEVESEEWVLLNTTKISIEAGETQKLPLLLDPSCDISGNFQVEVSSYLDKQPEKVVNSVVDFEVFSQESCFQSEIRAPEQIRINYGGENIPIVIINNGKKDTVDYSLAVENVDWTELSIDELSLRKGEAKKLNLGIYPSDDVPEGTYYAALKAKVGDTEYKKDIEIVLGRKGQMIQGVFWFVNYYLYYLLTGIFMIILIVLFALLKRKVGKKSKEHKKEFKGKIKGIVALLISVLVLVILIFLVIKFNILGFLWGLFKAIITKKTLIYLGILLLLIILVPILILYLIIVYGKIRSAVSGKEIEDEEDLEEKPVKEIQKKRKATKSSKISTFFRYIVLLLILFSAGYYSYSNFDELFSSYSDFAIVGIGILALLILMIDGIRRIKARKTKKKAKRKSRNFFKALLRLIIIIVIAWLIYYFFGQIVLGFNVVKDFFLMYYPYIVAGIILLLVVILVLNASSKKKE